MRWDSYWYHDLYAEWVAPTLFQGNLYMVTWTQLADTQITGAVSAVAAGQTLLDGWIDLVGGVWSTKTLWSDTTTQDYLSSVQESTPWSGGPLYRAQSEDAKSGRITAQIRIDFNQTIYFMLRANRATTSSAFNGYLLGIDQVSSKFYLHGFAVVAGAVNTAQQFVYQPLTTQPANGDLITVDIQLTQDTATTSSMAIVVTNTAGATLGSITITDNAIVNAAALQNVAGSFGVCAYSAKNSNTAGIKEIAVYSGDAAAPSATAYTLTGPASLTVNTAGTYTVTPNAAPASAVIVTPACTLSGTFSPATTTLPAGSSSAVTFAFTPSASGSGSLSTTNNGSLANPAALSLSVSSQITAPSAPAFTLVASSGQVTVTVSAPASTGGAAITGYPIFVGTSAGGEGSSPVTTLSAPGSYNITGLTNGTPVYVTVGAVNSVGTTQAAEQTVTPVAPASGGSIAVDSPAFLFSPGNWCGDNGRVGSSLRRTWNVGAYFVFTWTASASPSATLHLGPSGTGGYVTLYLNGVGTTVAATGDITLSGITPSAGNVLFVILSSTPQKARWNQGGNNIVVSGMTLDGGSSAGVSTAGTKGWIKIIGDSITEGIEANSNKDSIVYGYAFQVLQGLREQGYEVCISACGYSGYLVAGDSTGDVPAYYYVSGSSSGSGGTYDDSKSRWNKIDAGVSALDSNNHLSSYGAVTTEPVAVAVNYLTNEALNSVSKSDAQAAMTQAMIAHRAAAPDAWLFQIIPFGFYYSTKYDSSWLTVFNNAVSAYKAAYPSDTKVTTIDIGSSLSNTIQKNMGWYISASDDVHPLAPGHALVAPIVQASIMTSLENKKNQSYTFF